MYLVLSHNNGIHGIDYTKGLEETDRHCGKVHKYQTVHCRPLLYKKTDAQKEWKKEEVVNYDSLSDEEKYELGEPIFWLSSLHKFLTKSKRTTLKETVEIDVHGEEISREVSIENS